MTIHAAAGQIPPIPASFLDDENFALPVSHEAFEGYVVEEIRLAGGGWVVDGAEGCLM